MANNWNVNGVRIEGGTLILDAAPGYGNKKKYLGELKFFLDDGDWQELKKALAEREKAESMAEIASRELEEIKKELADEYTEKMQKVLKDTGLTQKDLPWELQPERLK